MNKKLKYCNLIIGICGIVLSIVLLYLSFLSILAVHHTTDWTAVDYWLAWFSALSFIGGFISGIFGTVSFAIFLTDICGDK